MLKLVTLTAILITAPGALFAAPGANADDPSARSPRVRAGDSRTATILLKGLERSDTIRSLVRQLEQRDVIVYLEMQPYMKRPLAGTMTWITATATHRFVRISINSELSTDAAVATLGHELQHALEVANAREIIDSQTLAAYYAKHGDNNRRHNNGWDTEAARVAGEDVRRELAGLPTTRVAESIQELNPDDWLIVYRRTRGMLPP
jgi:hypothetical protein